MKRSTLVLNTQREIVDEANMSAEIRNKKILVKMNHSVKAGHVRSAAIVAKPSVFPVLARTTQLQYLSVTTAM